MRRRRECNRPRATRAPRAARRRERGKERVIISSIVLVIFMRIESRRLGMTRRWVPIAGLLLVGVSLALPLFLYLCETHLETA
jgi:hypothetical protein